MRWLWLLLIMLALAWPVSAQETPPDFVEASLDATTAYVGQPVLYTWRWYLATANAGSSENARIDLPDFVGFGQETLPITDPVSQLIDGRQYQVITQQIRLYPRQSGTLDIEPVQIMLAETPFQPAQTLTSAAFRVVVQPLPAAAPPEFRNAIGQFTVAAALSAATVAAGEPVTLTLTISGAGNTAQLLPPALPLPETWRVYAGDSQFVPDTPQVGRRIVTWTLIPLVTGPQTVPPIIFAFFDPLTGQYVRRETLPLSLAVTPGSVTPPPPATLTPAPPPVVAAEPLWQPPGAIQPGVAVPAALLWLLWLLPPLLTAAVWWRTAVPRPAGVASAPAGSRALQQARLHVQQAAALAPAAACERTATIILAYVQARAGQTVTRDTLGAALDGLPPVLQSRLLACLEQAEAGRYAPVTAADRAALLKQTLAMLAQVDTQWQNS
ncbi:MAG: BatD family protein [Anaerolineae bacterium]|nr:BatD family protein [Anaerolineae bacterium]